MTFTVLLVIIGTESQKGWLFVLYFILFIFTVFHCVSVFFIQLPLMPLLSVLARTMWMWIFNCISHIIK